MFTWAARPSTATPLASPATMIASSPLVPLTMTVSAWPSPVPLPGGLARSRLTWVTSVPVRSLTVMVSAPPRALTLIPSTPLRSIGDVADVAGEPDRLPLAERSMFSLALEPLNSIVSEPACPSTVSLPSPGFQTKVSSPAPMKATSLPRPPIDQVVALAADEDVVAVAAVEGQSDRTGLREPLASMVSLPARALTVSWSIAASLPEMCTEAARPETVMPDAEPATTIRSAPAVPLTMTVSAWPSPCRSPEGWPGRG